MSATRASRRPASRPNSPPASVWSWSAMPGPLRALLVAAIAALLLCIYQQAHVVVDKLFGVLLLFLFAAIIAMLVTPLVDRVEAVQLFRGRRGLAVVAVNLTILGVLGGAIAAVAPLVAAQATSLAHATPHLVDQARGFVTTSQGELNARGIPIHIDIPKGIDAIAARVLGSVAGVITGTATILVDLVLVGVIGIYFQIQGRELIAAVRKLFPRQVKVIDFALVTAGSTLAGYVRGQLIMATIIGVYTGVALSLLGVRYALFIGVAAFLLEFLPLVGAAVAMALAILVALFQSPLLALLAGIVGLLGHAIEAYIVGPRITGHVTRLHPLAAMAALIIGAELGGLLGALFAVPVAGVANVFLGALYRSRRGEEAFYLQDEGETALEDLPSLGHEIARVPGPGEELLAEPVPHVAPRRRAKAGAESRSASGA